MSFPQRRGVVASSVGVSTAFVVSCRGVSIFMINYSDI